MSCPTHHQPIGLTCPECFMEDNKELMQDLTLLEQVGYPKASPADNAAADHWIEVTDAVYNEDIHISHHIMNAFRAGAKWADDGCT